MDKGAIKSFAIEARKLLIKSAVTEAGFYGITKDECSQAIQKGNDFEVYRTIAGTENRIYGETIKKRASLVNAINDNGFEQVMEETAYTWFNRLIAIRFMEVNDYLPTRTRVLSSERGSNTPDIVTQSLDVDLNLTSEEIKKVQKAKEENRYDDAFRMLFIKQCNELNKILPGLFEKTDDHMELLLKLSYTSDGVVRMLVDSISEDNFDVEKDGQVEIVGWMYQYYNSELNNLVYDGNMKKGKIEKDLIPAATQLFTPDWPIQYMVDNSLGKLWQESTSESSLKEKLNFYIHGQDSSSKIEKKRIENIRFLDPCMGSGHILVYAFDVFMKIYEDLGYTVREAAVLILDNNLYGLDIDFRAYQLAYFAIMMKARYYNRRIFTEINEINLFYFKESKSKYHYSVDYLIENVDFDKKKYAKEQIELLLDTFKNAKNIGSIMIVDERIDLEFISTLIDIKEFEEQISVDMWNVEDTRMEIMYFVKCARIMKYKYDVIVTNPPYLGDTRYNSVLSEYVTQNYRNVKTDLSMVMLVKCYKHWVSENGFVSFITPTSWLSLKSFEKLRYEIINDYWIPTLVDFGTELFDGKIGHNPITAWVICNKKPQKNTTSIRLVDFCYAQSYRKEKEFFNLDNQYRASQKKFLEVPGYPIAYWLTEEMFNIFKKGQLLRDLSFPRQGLASADNKHFLRLWWEVPKNHIDFGCKNPNDAIQSSKKWFPHNKGGTFRKWYGNRGYLVNWECNGSELKAFKKSVIRNPNYYFRKSVGYSDVTSGDFSIRYYGYGFIFDSTGPSFFNESKVDDLYLMAVLNSVVAKAVLKIFCPSLHYTQSAVAKTPIIIDEKKYEEVIRLARQCLEIVKEDWNNYEVSWDYTKHVFLRDKDEDMLLEDRWVNWERYNDSQRNLLKQSEEAINDILISTYGLIGELISEVSDDTLSIRKSNMTSVVEEFISYVVGCIFGRYKSKGCKNAEFTETTDVLLICDNDYFENDIVNQFEKYLIYLFGEETLDSNMRFICNSLNIKGTTYVDSLRIYFQKSFYKYHCKMYSNVNSKRRPIYWMFTSGKEKGFMALCYIHKYNKDTVGHIRTDYLHKTQSAIEAAMKNVEYVISESNIAVDKAKANKDRNKYIKQLNEIRRYDYAIAHIALKRINLDLDDGVLHNYSLFQNIEIRKEGSSKQKVNLLEKI